MNEESQQASTRRQLLATALRGAAAGAIAALAAVLMLRNGRAPGPLEGQNCINEGLCRSCAAFDGCRLPAALVRKQSPDKS
ncbi:MAG: hypothetical protein ACE15C_12745 [Phycisphaerae bacterium]